MLAREAVISPNQYHAECTLENTAIKKWRENEAAFRASFTASREELEPGAGMVSDLAYGPKGKVPLF